jgi:hypothetical protein
MPGVEQDLDLVATMDERDHYAAFLIDEEGPASGFRKATGCSQRSAPIVARTTSALLPHAEGRRQGRQEQTDRGWPGARAARHRAHRVVRARGARAHGAAVWSSSGPPAQELRIAGITTIDAAKRYLREVFLPRFNAWFAVTAAGPGTAFVPYVGRPLEDILYSEGAPGRAQQHGALMASSCRSTRTGR